MKKVKASIAAKLTCYIVVLSVLFLTMVAYIGYRQFTVVLEKRYNEAAYEVAEVAKSYLNADKLEVYLETGQKDKQYYQTLEQLDTLVKATESMFIYVGKIDTSTYKKITYIYDSVHPSTGYDRYELGYEAEDLDPAYTESLKKLITTGERIEQYLYSDNVSSGAHTTAGVAVRDSKGKIVAIVCVEKAMTELNIARMTYVKQICKATIWVLVIFIVLYILILKKGMITPLLHLTRETKQFVEGGKDFTATKLDQITQTDEIGVLARSIEKMQMDIVQYIKDLTKITAEKERIGAELDVARNIQASMLPSEFPAFPEIKEFDIYATMTPAKEVGGDFYDFFMIDDTHLAMVMADVSGKGVAAALFMAIAKTTIQTAVLHGGEPAEILERVNNHLCENNEAEMFVTVWLGILDITTGVVNAVNAGHEYPVIGKGPGKFDLLKDKHGFVVAGMEDISYKGYTFTLESGDCLYLYTDGVAEATNLNNELFGTDRMLLALNSEKTEEPDKLLKTVKQHIDQFVGEGEQFDDITMLGLWYKGRER